MFSESNTGEILGYNEKLRKGWVASPVSCWSNTGSVLLQCLHFPESYIFCFATVIYLSRDAPFSQTPTDLFQKSITANCPTWPSANPQLLLLLKTSSGWCYLQTVEALLPPTLPESHLSSTTSASTEISQFLITTICASQCPLQKSSGSVYFSAFATCARWDCLCICFTANSEMPRWMTMLTLPICLIPCPCSSPPSWYCSHASPVPGRASLSLVFLLLKPHSSLIHKISSQVLSPGAILFYFLSSFF